MSRNGKNGKLDTIALLAKEIQRYNDWHFSSRPVELGTIYVSCGLAIEENGNGQATKATSSYDGH